MANEPVLPVLVTTDSDDADNDGDQTPAPAVAGVNAAANDESANPGTNEDPGGGGSGDDLRKAFYSRFRNYFNRANTVEAKASSVDAFASLIAGRSVCAAVFFKETGGRIVLHHSYNAPHDNVPITGMLHWELKRFGFYQYRFKYKARVKMDGIDFIDKRSDAETTYNSETRTINPPIPPFVETFDDPQLDLAPPGLRVTVGLVDSKVEELVQQCFDRHECSVELPSVPLICDAEPTRLLVMKLCNQLLMELRDLGSSKERQASHVQTLGLMLSYELRSNRTKLTTTKGKHNLFTQLDGETAARFLTQCEGIVRHFVLGGSEANASWDTVKSTTAPRKTKFSVGLAKAARTALRIVTTFNFLVQQVKTDPNNIVRRFLMQTLPLSDKIIKVDGGFDRRVDVHAEMRLLNAMHDAIVAAPGNFGISMHCCGHCFVYLRKAGIERVSHGNFYPNWWFPVTAWTRNHAQWLVEGDLQAALARRDSIDNAVNFSACGQDGHVELATALAIDDGKDIQPVQELFASV